LDEQLRALSLVRIAGEQTAAPPALRWWLAALRGAVRQRQRRGVTAATAVAASIAALVLQLAGAEAPTALAAAGLGARPPTDRAPAAGEQGFLRAAVDGVRFPRWTRLGWKPTGARRDAIAGRGTTTVFYKKDGNRVAYTIVGGGPLAVPAGASGTQRDGKTYALFTSPQGRAVTWLRDGKTCILVGEGVAPRVLLKLASSSSRG
jgi:hypothetical protein